MSKCECTNCVHQDVCRIREFPSIQEILKDGCHHYKDKSLFVELPCKLWETNFDKITENAESFAKWFVELSKTKSIDGDMTHYYNLGNSIYGKWTEEKQEAIEGAIEWLQQEAK